MEKSESVERAAKKVSGVVDVHCTDGIYDMIIRAEGEDESRLAEVIRRIKRIDGVTATLTSIVYKPSSNESGLVVGNPPKKIPISDVVIDLENGNMLQ
jgi:DNA-binding Lrp family transcriptional regulator